MKSQILFIMRYPEKGHIVTDVYYKSGIVKTWNTFPFSENATKFFMYAEIRHTIDYRFSDNGKALMIKKRM